MDSYNNVLQKAREEARRRDLKLEGSSLRAIISHLRAKCARFIQQLAEEAVALKAKLRKKLMDGSFEAVTSILAMVATVYLVEYSLKAFLPQTDLTFWWQRVVPTGFIVATVLSFHFAVRRTLDGDLIYPRWLPILSFIFLLAGLLLLAVIRGFLVKGTRDFLEELRSLESWALFLGVLSFSSLSLGLDLIVGLAGASSWEKISYALSRLGIYHRLEKTEEQIERAEARLAEIESEIGPIIVVEGSPEVA